MRLSAWTAISTWVARRSSVRERSGSPITCLNRPTCCLGSRPRRVAGCPLPGHAVVLGDVLQMAVPLRRRGLGCLARHGGRARRDDDGRFGVALGNTGTDAVLVVSTIGGERGHHSCDLVEQRADLGAVVDLLGRERGCDDLAAAGIQADVQLPPQPARLGAVLLQQPLARAAQAQSRNAGNAAECRRTRLGSLRNCHRRDIARPLVSDAGAQRRSTWRRPPARRG